MNSKKKKPLKSKKVSNSLPKELFELESAVGQFMEYWGFKKIHGRIWTHLFLSQSSMDTMELMSRLKVSKGLMSLAIRDLLHYNVIETDFVGKHGTTFYKTNPNILSVISNVLKTREAEMLKLTLQSAASLEKRGKSEIEELGISTERLKNLLQMTASAKMLLQAFLVQEQGNELARALDLSTNDSAN